MKPAIDLSQILLSLPGVFGYIACVLLLLLLWQVMRLAGEVVALAGNAAALIGTALRYLRSVLIRPTWPRLFGVGIIALPLSFFRLEISDALQVLEQRINPAFVTSDTSRHALAVYEAELSRRVDTYEAQVIRRRTEEMAAKVGSTPLAIYEVAFSECGLNPFEIRKDGKAAGWIQFTRSGLIGLPATLEQVKEMCRRRDVEGIMDLTEQYLISRAAGRPLPAAVDVYTAVFAPAFVGREEDAVMYSGWSNDAYALNMGLDGYFTEVTADGRQRIVRSLARCDGKITIRDLRLHLEAKKSRLLSRH